MCLCVFMHICMYVKIFIVHLSVFKILRNLNRSWRSLSFAPRSNSKLSGTPLVHSSFLGGRVGVYPMLRAYRYWPFRNSAGNLVEFQM